LSYRTPIIVSLQRGGTFTDNGGWDEVGSPGSTLKMSDEAFKRDFDEK
jgi:hypothetical protein